MIKINLSPKQQEIVNLDTGAFLVEASAGSGKTRVLTERVKRILNITSAKVLVITFTNKASEELKGRLNLSRLKDSDLFVGTFHSFCQSIFESRFKLLGFDKMPHIFDDEKDRLEIIEEAIDNIPNLKDRCKALDPKKKRDYIVKALTAISIFKRELLELYELDEQLDEQFGEDFSLLYQEYQGILKANNAIDFDDLILFVYNLLSNNVAVQNLYSRSFSHIFVDEGQDLNKVQYYLLKALCGNIIKNIMIVGDPNQAIYGFNGSSTKYMQRLFVEDFNAQRLHLDENFRSAQKIIKAANKLMGLQVETEKYVIPGVFNIFEAEDEKMEAEIVVAKIKELVNEGSNPDIEGPIDYSRISILGRNKFVFGEIEKKLNENRIPFYYKSGRYGMKFETKYLQMLVNLFKVTINPADHLHARRLNSLLEVSDFRDLNKIEKSPFSYFEEIYKAISKISVENFKHQIEYLLFCVKENADFSEDEKAQVYNELSELQQLWKTYSYQKMKPTLVGFQSALSLGGIGTRDPEEGVCISTVHTMKGQEADIVFLIGLDDGTFPYYLAIAKNGAEMKQEKNNLYVAFTRAKRFLYVSYPSTRIMPWGDSVNRRRSRFLEDF